MLRARILAGLACTALAVGIPAAASATAPEEVNPNCFGKGASQIARGEGEILAALGGMGAHSSSQDNPRIGIGNLVGNEESPFVHQSELADYLGADC